MNTGLVKLLLKTQWPLFVGPFIALTGLLGGQNAFALYADPDDEIILMVISVWSLVGVLFGVLSNVFEQLPSHREFMIHRGIAARAYFMTKLCVSLAFAVVPWFGSVFAATWLWRTIAPTNGIFAEAGFGVTRLFALASSGLAGFGFGVWCTTLRRGRGTNVANILIAAGALALAEYLLVSATTDEIAPSVSRFVIFQCAAFIAFMTAAYLNYQRQHDPDRPVPLAAQFGHASVVGLALTAQLFVLGPAIQWSIVRNLTGYPIIAVGPDGRTGLFDVVRDDDRETYFPVNDRHERAGEPVVRSAGYAPIYTPRSLPYVLNRLANETIPPRPVPRQDLRLGVAIQSMLFDPSFRLYIERPAGQLILDRREALTYNDNRAVWIEPLRIHMRRPDGRAFGSRTMPLGVSSAIGRNDFSSSGVADKGPIVLGDPDDGTLWRVTFRTVPSGIAAVPLPNGDRFVSWAWRADAGDVSGDSGDLSAVVIQGANGNYGFDAESRVVPTTADSMSWRTVLRAGQPLVRVYDGGSKTRIGGGEPPLGAPEVRDPFFVRIEVLADDDTVAFAHDYAPRRTQERVAHNACIALSLLRPPLAADALVPGLDFDRHMRGFANPWLAFILASLLAAQAAFMLRGRGACSKRMSLWTSMIVVLGPGAFIAFLLLERKAAFARMPRAEVEEPRLPRVVESIATST